MSEVNVTMDTFESEVLKSEGTVIVDFWAPWCGPCKMLAPILAEIAEEKASEVKVCKVNVDDESDLAVKYDVVSIPTVLIFKNGEIANKSVGFRSKQDMLALL